MKIIAKYEYRLPNWALCALMYGDESGLEDEDLRDLDAFLKREHYVTDWDVANDEETGEPCEPYFCTSPDLGLAGDVVDVIGYVYE